jgi:hypothetical protein
MRAGLCMGRAGGSAPGWRLAVVMVEVRGGIGYSVVATEVVELVE